MSNLLRWAFAALAILTLAACDTAEERAEKHYQSALELLENGDTQRALVEFRNVFSLNEGHLDARRVYAKTTRSLGNIPESYANFLRISEQLPDDLEARLALTEMAIKFQNWDEAERHGAAILASATGIEGDDIPLLALEFRKAVLAKDAARIRELTRQAEGLADSHPDNEILIRMLIEGYVNDNELDKALALTDRALSIDPDNRVFYPVKATLLSRKQDFTALESHLRDMIKRFPDDEDTKIELVRLLASKGDIDSAREFLRAEIDTADDKRGAHITLISFIQRTEGREAALAEIESAIPLYDDNSVLKALQAGVMFELGQKSEGVSILQSVVDTSEPGEESDRYKVTLARMLIETGNEVGARQLVEDVLARDENQVMALKLSAGWLIDGDEPDEAISTLRRVLDQEPEDAEAMTLMAKAHERAGNAQLAQDLLSLAAEASGYAPRESLRYARLLVDQERFTSAEQVVIDALRVSPGHLALLDLLGGIYLATDDWPRAAQVVQTLQRQESDVAQLAGQRLQLQIISRREGQDQGAAFLEQIIAEQSGGTAAKVALIRARLSQNRNSEALALAKELVEEFPDDPRTRQVLGTVQFASGQLGDAEQTLRETVQSSPTQQGYLQYIRILGAQAKEEEARAAIDEGLAALPDNPDLLWAKASYLERVNDIDGAIKIYEQLYERISDSPIVANNLASLLVTYRDDDASLERAFTVGRRLRGTEVPPFQDTYGWILFRRGETEEALTYLEPAASVLAEDPIVLYHLGRAYQELGRSEDALKQYERAVELAGDDDSRAQISDAAARIAEISTAPKE
ncbi:MAG: tetratricopeptide repeat protein [Silicimonas sp.]|nr:tetratricopeptide repeat protein [Silicimonas sp.]